ncbi:hypothetical protein [Humibacter ginsengiterrae]
MLAVAPNARFGITADDFSYLNPISGDVADAELKYGIVYNLSPADRGVPPGT